MADDKAQSAKPIRVLVLDDRQDNLLLRSTILRQHGYDAVTATTIEEAEQRLDDIDIAVLDYHLGAGKFGTEVAESLRRKRPEVPIIILSGTFERVFGGGSADMHLLKGYSSTDDLLNALRSFEAKRRGKPVVVDARDFYYSRIAKAMGDDVALEILDREGNWLYVNDTYAGLLGKRRPWFAGRNLFAEFPDIDSDWRDTVRSVADTRETHVDRSFRGLPHLPDKNPRWVWNVLIFPLKLHDGRPGVVVSARVIEKKNF